jgi:hypothetical protein
MASCDMRKDCAEAVTHVGSKGYVYCATHAIDRRLSRHEYTRRMRGWELKLVAAGQPLPSYKPVSRRSLETKREPDAGL